MVVTWLLGGGKFEKVSPLTYAPLRSINDKTRRQGEDFTGNISQTRSSHSQKNWAPRKQGTFLDMQEPKENRQTRVDNKSKPTARAETNEMTGG